MAANKKDRYISCQSPTSLLVCEHLFASRNKSLCVFHRCNFEICSVSQNLRQKLSYRHRTVYIQKGIRHMLRQSLNPEMQFHVPLCGRSFSFFQANLKRRLKGSPVSFYLLRWIILV